jgi:hypothetical protein
MISGLVSIETADLRSSEANVSRKSMLSQTEVFALARTAGVASSGARVFLQRVK